MQPHQRDKLLEDIAQRTHSEYQDGENIKKVLVVGSIGAGKSSFLYAVHKQLQYFNACIRIEQKRATSSNQLSIQRTTKNIRRANATIEPEKLVLYTHSEKGIIPISIIAEGSHENAKKVLRTYEDITANHFKAVVFCLDLSFLDYLFKNQYWEREWSTESPFGGYVYSLDEDLRFKGDLNTCVYNSLLASIHNCDDWKRQGATIIPLLTHYWSVDYNRKKELLDGNILDNIDEKIDDDYESKIPILSDLMRVYEEETQTTRRVMKLSELFNCLPIPVDSRTKHPFGVEEAAYQIALAAIGNPREDNITEKDGLSSNCLRLISFSNHRKDTERVVKYKSTL